MIGKGRGNLLCTCLCESDSSPAVLYNLGSGSWLASANDTTVHYLTIHCLCYQTIMGPAVQLAHIPPPQSATRGLHCLAHKLHCSLCSPMEGWPGWDDLGGWLDTNGDELRELLCIWCFILFWSAACHEQWICAFRRNCNQQRRCYIFCWWCKHPNYRQCRNYTYCGWFTRAPEVFSTAAVLQSDNNCWCMTIFLLQLVNFKANETQF